jgi:hypothetical protein
MGCRVFHSILHVCSLACSGGSTFCHQWRDSKRCHIPHDTDATGNHTHPNSYASAVLWFVLEATLHKRYRDDFKDWLIYIWPATSSAVTLLLMRISMQTCSMSPTTGTLIVLCQWHMFNHFWTRWSIHIPSLYQNTILCLSPQKSNHCTLLCFGTRGRQSNHVDTSSGKRQLNDEGQVSHYNKREVACLWLCMHSAVKPIVCVCVNILQVLSDLLSQVILWKIYVVLK